MPLLAHGNARMYAADRAEMAEADLTFEQLAERLEEVLAAAMAAMGGGVAVGDWTATYHEAMGKIPCPWGHPGLYPKAHIILKKMETGENLVWSDLAIHLIGEHGFYQGRGSPYRLDPSTVKRILEL